MQEQQADNRSGYATVKEVAQFTGLSVAKLYVLMGQGQLRYAKVGKSRRIPWSDARAFMERHTITVDTPQLAPA
jgi:excisionase family DNA binding protein